MEQICYYVIVMCSSRQSAAELQNMCQNILQVFISFFGIPGDIKYLSQFLYDDIHQKNGQQ